MPLETEEYIVPDDLLQKKDDRSEKDKERHAAKWAEQKYGWRL